MEREVVLGYEVCAVPASIVVDEMFLHVLDGNSEPRWVACLNPHSYAVAVKSEEFRTALLASDWLLPDGVGVVLASRLLGGQVKSRITGADVFLGLSACMNKSGGGGVFFLGATDRTLAEIERRFRAEFPHVPFCGSYSPPFVAEYSEADTTKMVDAVNRSGANVLWVAMTAPKQEKWIFSNLNRLNVSVVGAIGAVFDFYAGNVRRSSAFFQRMGLEWLPRLVQEPRRLWRRTFVSAPIFLCHVFIAFFKRY